MARPLEGDGVCIGGVDEPVDGEVPGKRVRPFVAEHLDGLRFPHVLVEEDHEPLFPPKALAQNSCGEPGSPNDDGEGWRAFPSKACQNRLKFLPTRAVRKSTKGGRDRLGVPNPNPRKGTAMTAENRQVMATSGNHPCSVAPMKEPRYP